VSLKTLQKLLVLSALAWALLPTWGGLVYASSFVVLAVGTASRVRAARAILDEHRETLAKGLSAETLEWMRRFPFVYVWRDSAKQWGTTWRMSGILAIFLAPWFAIRALFLRETWELALLAPLLVLLVVGVRIALRLELTELLTDAKWRAFGPRHEEAVRYLGLRAAAGLWPPVRSPDGLDAPPPQSSPPVRPGGGPALAPPTSVRPRDDGPQEPQKPAE
jgi:hypothetical protein